MIEFKIQHINSDDFSKELQQLCLDNLVEGYVIYSPDRTVASGIMEGKIKKINMVKKWIELNGKNYVSDPLETNIYLSCFLIATKPTKLKFDEVLQVPK